MKIKDIVSYALRFPLDKPIYASGGKIQERTAMLVKIITDEGIEGWGECYGSFVEVTKSIIENVCKPILIGKDPFDNEVLWQLQYDKLIRGGKGPTVAAVSGLDIALWDIKGKALGLPIAKLLGGMYRDSVKCYATGMYTTGAEDQTKVLAKEAEGYARDSFEAMKMKVGYGVEKDIQYVAAVRKVIGDKIGLMVDANCAYDARTAIMVGKKFEEYNVYWFEEPVPPTDLDGYVEVKNALSMYIAGGELECTKFGFRELISRRAMDIVQPDICWAGGLTEGKKIAALCESWGLRCFPHVWGTSVAIAANLHLIASLPSLHSINDPLEPMIEFDRSPNPLRDNLVNGPIAQKNSRIDVPKGPGLGIEVDEQLIKRIASNPSYKF